MLGRLITNNNSAPNHTTAPESAIPATLSKATPINLVVMVGVGAGCYFPWQFQRHFINNGLGVSARASGKHNAFLASRCIVTFVRCLLQKERGWAHLFRVLDILVSVELSSSWGYFCPRIIKARLLQEVVEWWLVDLSRTNCCRANLNTTLMKEKGLWMMKIAPQRFRLMVLIMYMATLGMQI